MAALNFPDSPNVNDVFTVGSREWIWDGSAWVSNSGREYTRLISDTAPSSPIEGDEWFNSSTGKLYIYYDSNWVEVGASVSGQDGADATLTRTIRSESADTSLVSGDANQVIRFTGTSAQVLTVDDVLSVGDRVEVIQDNSGGVEFSSGSGVTLLSTTGGFLASGQNAKVEVMCVAAGEYRLFGDTRLNAPMQATGGTIVDDGGYRYHTFTSTDNFVVESDPSTVEYLVVAGGGGGGSNRGGGGGAGGFITSTAEVTTQTYSVTVGAGGAGAAGVSSGERGASGSLSAFAAFDTSSGGGGGGGNLVQGREDALNGGSGGGGGHNDGLGGTGVSGQGNAGGNQNSSTGSGAAGGGGASQAGQVNPNEEGGDGGAGSNSLLEWATATSTGDSGYYAGGGGGGASGSGNAGGAGGAGGGGNGTTSQTTEAEDGQTSTGGGGGGGGAEATVYYAGGNGGSGIVIIRYPI